MPINEEDKRIKIKLEQDFPFNRVDIKEDPPTKDRLVFFNDMFTGFAYSPTDTKVLKENKQEQYAEIIFYENLKQNLYQYLVTNKV